MKQDVDETAREGRGGHHRRYPYLTRDDVAALDALEESMGAAVAKEFERLIRAQHTEQQAFRHRFTVESDLGADLDVAIAARTSPARAHRDDRRRRGPRAA